MIHLIWSIINIIVFLYFLYLLFGFIVKGKRIINTKFKVVSIFILTIGIIQIISASNSKKNTNIITLNDNYTKKFDSKIKHIIIEDNLTFDINILVKYSDEKNELIPIESNSYLSGFISGYDWEFKGFYTNNYKQNEKTAYIAEGILNWNLFGITFYSESKTLKGVIK